MLTGTTSLAEYIDIQDNYTTGTITATLEARTTQILEDSDDSNWRWRIRYCSW